LNKRQIYYKLPPWLRLIVRRVYFLPIDIIDTIKGNRNKFQPPKGLIYIGAGDFKKQGNHQLNLLIKHIDLKKDDIVLDIGCGIGRTAAALTEYLSANARYDGFDTMKKGIKWCQSKISQEFSNFNFKYVPLNNDLYNKHKLDASQFNFPYIDLTYDKVFLFSVFTHMLPIEVNNYLKEINRVLKNDGKVLATFFLFEDEQPNDIIPYKQDFIFKVNKTNYWLMDEVVISANIAIQKKYLEEIANNNGLKITNIIRGYWNSNTPIKDNDYQDIVIFEKL